ncbi:MAG: tetratricopeptide repeat-containing sensor histidine kinase, partial [Candidatus Cloacimonadaceae bacterium]|nr:tetratricopeptide repeat-containing sensor histidine kinase [Candidatus Cloacimonadaceae bacterium]
MIKDFTEQSRAFIEGKIDEIVRVDREATGAIYQDIINFLEDYDLSGNPLDHIKILKGLARFHVMQNEPQKVLEFMHTAILICEEKDLKGELVSIRSAEAIAYSLQGDHARAIGIWEELIEGLDEDHYMWHSLVNNLIVAYTNTKQFAHSVDLSYRLLAWLEARDMKEYQAIALINLGNAYNPLKQHSKAKEAYVAAINLAEELDNIPCLRQAFGNIGQTFREMGDHETALDYATRAMVLNLKYSSDSNVAASYSDIGAIHRKMDNYTEALLFMKQALMIYKKTDNQPSLASTYLNMASTYMGIEDNEKALKFAEAGSKICEELELQPLLITSSKLLGHIYLKSGRFEESARSFLRLSELMDEQYIEVTTRLISVEEADYLKKKIEAQGESYRLKNIELENTLSLLNKLISVISHDVRGPISNAAAAMRMIHNREFDESTSSELVPHLIDSMEGVSSLLSEILLWIDAEHFKTNIAELMKKLNLTPLLQNVIQMYTSQMRQKQIQLNYEISSANIDVVSEPNALKAVFRNILSNAIKFTPCGGTIHIKV